MLDKLIFAIERKGFILIGLERWTNKIF